MPLYPAEVYLPSPDTAPQISMVFPHLQLASLLCKLSPSFYCVNVFLAFISFYKSQYSLHHPGSNEPAWPWVPPPTRVYLLILKVPWKSLQFFGKYLLSSCRARSCLTSILETEDISIRISCSIIQCSDCKMEFWLQKHTSQACSVAQQHSVTQLQLHLFCFTSA